MNEYPIGQEVELTLVFKDAQDAPKDPASATVEILHPDKTTKETLNLADLTRESLGTYTYRLIPADLGRWRYWGQGVGTETVAAKGSFLVVEKGT